MTEPEPAKAAFDHFYRTEHLLLLRFIRSLGASWEEAWDISQHCCLKALERWDSISDPGKWIRTTMVREYRRGKARQAEETSRMAWGGWEPRPYLDKLDLPSEEAGVFAAIASLPPRQAEVMALTYDGYEPREIVGILLDAYPGENGITSDAVRASLYQAREKLKRLLAGNMEA